MGGNGLNPGQYISPSVVKATTAFYISSRLSILDSSLTKVDASCAMVLIDWRGKTRSVRQSEYAGLKTISEEGEEGVKGSTYEQQHSGPPKGQGSRLRDSESRSGPSPFIRCSLIDHVQAIDWDKLLVCYTERLWVSGVRQQATTIGPYLPFTPHTPINAACCMLLRGILE